MSKVTGKIKLIKDPRKGWVLVPIDLNNLRQQAIDKWVKGDASQSILLDMELKQPYEEKTLSQLGYLHAAVWPVFYAYYQTQGIPVENEQVREMSGMMLNGPLGSLSRLTAFGQMDLSLRSNPLPMPARRRPVRPLMLSSGWLLSLAWWFSLLRSIYINMEQLNLKNDEDN
jgi:hypothetical protein